MVCSKGLAQIAFPSLVHSIIGTAESDVRCHVHPNLRSQDCGKRQGYLGADRTMPYLFRMWLLGVHLALLLGCERSKRCNPQWEGPHVCHTNCTLRYNRAPLSCPGGPPRLFLTHLPTNLCFLISSGKPLFYESLNLKSRGREDPLFLSVSRLNCSEISYCAPEPLFAFQLFRLIQIPNIFSHLMAIPRAPPMDGGQIVSQSTIQQLMCVFPSSCFTAPLSQ